MIERLLSRIIEKIKSLETGAVFAFIFFIVAVLFCIFGFWKTIFILLFTFAGFITGSFFLGDDSRFKKFLDRILPPGRVR